MPMSDIAYNVGISKQHAGLAIEELRRAGVLIVEYEPDRARRTAQAYRFPANWDIPGSGEQYAAGIKKQRKKKR